ncbi:MAG: hypothetical protein GQ540_03890 [Lutibacter sp.]|uniref:hypothetical protein n=1 Tax=Lutibacter sp. TaxID=1925666 RepID=UPI0019F376E7|nr:hypothetical protein [Lutibacter sp.]NOR27655.1 hypothetical protein [Lutibacter sp.]
MENTAKRMEGETFEAYKTRRKLSNMLIKNYLKGRKVSGFGPKGSKLIVNPAKVIV